MRAALFHEHGGPEVLRVEEIPTPTPGPGEILLQVRAAAMNHLDLWVRRGLPIDTTLPHIGGSDFAGTVSQLGEGVAGLEIGHRVVVNPILYCGRCRECRRGEEPLCARFGIIGEHTNGGFAEYVVVPADRAYPIPDEVSFDDAACLPVSYQTAWRAVVTRAAVRAGEDVLVLGASGGTAIATIQVARLAGARVFAVTSGAENVARVLALGAHRVYDRNEVDFSRALQAETGKRGVDVVIENVGEPTWEGSVRSLAPGGRLVTYGATAGPKVGLDIRRVFWKQIQVMGSTMANRGEFEAMLRAVWGGGIEPIVDQVFPLDEIRAAHERLEAGRQFGKVVLHP
jgi:NADPH:quinone reductase-like Zn-dependent oxidoreductase